MRVSAKTDYALCAVLLLAAKQPDFINIEALLSERAMPRKFLAAILVSLRDAGIVNTRRGPKGGYALAGAPDEVTVGAVFRAINGPFSYHRAGDDGSSGALPVDRTPTWSVVGAILEDALDEITLAQVLAGTAGQPRQPGHPDAECGVAPIS